MVVVQINHKPTKIWTTTRVLICTVEGGIVYGGRGVIDFHGDESGAAVGAIATDSDFSLIAVTCEGECYFSNYRFYAFDKLVTIDLDDELMTKVNNCKVNGVRKCRWCKSYTPKPISICLHCHGNWHTYWLAFVGVLPLFGIPFAAARATLVAARAYYDKKNRGLAVVEVAFVLVDIATAPFIVAGLLAVGPRLAAYAGRAAATGAAAGFVAGVADDAAFLAVKVGVVVGTAVSRFSVHCGARALDRAADRRALMKEIDCLSFLRQYGTDGEDFLVNFPCRCQGCGAAEIPEAAE